MNKSAAKPAGLPALAGIARALLRGLEADLAATGSSASVHGARRTIKKVRSLLELVRPALAETAHGALKAELKTAADALAGRRRAEALVAIAAGLGNSQPAALELRKVAEAARGQLPVSEDATRKARVAIAAARQLVAAWRLPRQSGPFVTKAFAATYRKARKGLAQALKSGSVAELHEARKHIIRHLHHLELLAPALPDDLSRRRERLGKMRVALGDINDLEELARLARSHRMQAEGPLERLIEARMHKLQARAGKEARRLFRRKTNAFCKVIGANWT
jgi:CHAD domain-containing protein